MSSRPDSTKAKNKPTGEDELERTSELPVLQFASEPHAAASPAPAAGARAPSAPPSLTPEKAQSARVNEMFAMLQAEQERVRQLTASLTAAEQRATEALQREQVARAEANERTRSAAEWRSRVDAQAAGHAAQSGRIAELTAALDAEKTRVRVLTEGLSAAEQRATLALSREKASRTEAAQRARDAADQRTRQDTHATRIAEMHAAIEAKDAHMRLLSESLNSAEERAAQALEREQAALAQAAAAALKIEQVRVAAAAERSRELAELRAQLGTKSVADSAQTGRISGLAAALAAEQAQVKSLSESLAAAEERAAQAVAREQAARAEVAAEHARDLAEVRARGAAQSRADESQAGRVAELSATLAAEQAQIKALQKEVAAAEERATLALTREQALQTEAYQHERELMDLRARLEAQPAADSARAGRLGELATALEAAQAQVRTLTENLAAAEERAAQALTREQVLHTENHERTRELQELRARFDAQAEGLRHALARVDLWEGMLKDTEAARAAEVDKALEERALATQRANALQSELEALKERAAERAPQAAAPLPTAAPSPEEFRARPERIAELEGDLRAAEEQIHRLEAELRGRDARPEAEPPPPVAEESIASVVPEVAAAQPVTEDEEDLHPADGPTRYLALIQGDSEVLHVLGRRSTIGRDASNDICVDAKFVSRTHAVIFAGPAQTIIEDLNSTNGTLVNDERVTRAVLHDGDTVRIGMSLLRFVVRKSQDRA